MSGTKRFFQEGCFFYNLLLFILFLNPVKTWSIANPDSFSGNLRPEQGNREIITNQSAPKSHSHVIIGPVFEEKMKKPEILNKKVAKEKLISLNYQKIEIRSALQLIADFSGINIVVSKSVTGEMTLRLDRVPWDQALKIILETNGLHQYREGNVIRVTNDLTPVQQGYLEKTTETGLPLQSLFVQLKYAKAKDLALLLNEASHSMLSKEGNFRADSRTNTLWIQDNKLQLDAIKKIISQLDIPVRQVLIEARIVHVARESIQDLGIRFDLSRSGQTENNNKSPGGFNIDLGKLGENPASVGIALAKLGNGVLLDLELSALESEDKAEIIASPRLMTMNQQTATIESGEEIPYQESTSSGATNLTFKKAVLGLKVTPQITPDNKLLLALRINQDTLSGRMVNQVPSIFTREIETTVLVKNGQTLVLGGIYKQNKQRAVYRIPALGRLPFLGSLFRNKHRQVRNEELLIFITPKIMVDVQDP